MKEQRINIVFKQQARLALWKICGDNQKKGKNVFLTHGTFSNRKICMGISEFLVKNGYTCWILEWRNHGDSSKMNGPYNFETIGKEEVTTALDYLFEIERLEQIDCVTHSGGGISLTIHLIENPQNIKRIKRIVFFGCQSSGAAHTILNRSKIWIGKYISKALGQIPAQRLGRPHNEDYSFMKQWFDWNLTNTFTSGAGRDYRLAMPTLPIPILSIGGLGDNFIAPVSGCKTFLSRFNYPHNKFLACGKATGFKEDYNHSRLIYSRNAEQEIYPEVLRWLG